ncbi:MAG: hypothetical protein JWM27_4024 [Gemmatimonadetes bacterium]|nr:hypothetical protein [Gemmatimonadota bacterium]
MPAPSNPDRAWAQAIRPAEGGDLPDMLALLVAADLPEAGLRAAFPLGFLVAHAPDGTLAGAAGVEAHGSAGLLRSVAVHPRHRGSGLGQALAAAAVAWARSAGVRELFLLTTTADGFFPRLGFAVEDRARVPDALLRSEEFRGACPASAVLMHRSLMDA